MMRVSWACEQGSPARPNEDFVATALGAVVVLDGMSIDMDLETGCGHGRPWYVGQLATRLLVGLLDHALSPDAALAQAITGTAAAHGGRCDLSHPWTPATTVVALRVRDQAADYLVLADSTLLLDQDGRVTALTAVGSGFAAADPRVAGRALTGRVPLPELRRAALLTDGATRLADSFGLTDWPQTLATLAGQGPAALIEQVREAERSDPDGRRWPRHKRHDDATVAYCEFATP
ncbi:protein phosphatase 2C domain-containing protein [Actinoallomurus soli]|uniref:protein phosphatase 2C domain-containing protein n=1 Tax=Actinoallomurus soli TaxID=2952535 RepID=UPI0020938029|nr:protein phosphatase 2C domain-containing protein [Actinoallomurus soli]MCO5967353.1 protein phosphatase 2C domain-containing protein [Actinoallomurus soli]